MELRVLRYFLTVAREENITRAARLLHITQPTLSRQLIQLEEELGVILFHRGKYHIGLTEDGLLLKRRAQELIALSDKTVQELSHQGEVISGEIAIGCGEMKSMAFLADCIVSFQAKHPLVQFEVYSAVADDIQEKLEHGLLDIGFLVDPVEVRKYEFLRLPFQERWGVLARKDSKLAGKEAVTPKDLAEIPLLLGRRELVKNELASWFGEVYEQLSVPITYNLITNAAALVRSGAGAAICVEHAGVTYTDLQFIPLSPVLEMGIVLVWKKNQLLPEAVGRFIQYVKNAF